MEFGIEPHSLFQARGTTGNDHISATLRLETDNSIDNTGNSTGSDTDNTDIVSTGGTGNSTRPRFRHDISILLGRERRKAERNRAFSASSSATRSQK